MKQVIEKISDHQVHCNSTHNKQDKEPKYPPTVNGHTHTHTHTHTQLLEKFRDGSTEREENESLQFASQN